MRFKEVLCAYTEEDKLREEDTHSKYWIFDDVLNFIPVGRFTLWLDIWEVIDKPISM